MKIFEFLIFLLFLTLKSFSQGHYVPAYTGAGQEQMNIIITSAVILGVNLEPGDEIAAFDGNVCCGVLILNQTIYFGASSTYQVVKASREDPGESNGYIVGHPILFKIWDSSNNLEISGISAIYLDPNTQLPIVAPTYNSDSPPVFVKLSASQPIANAGTNQSIDEGLLVTLDGSASSDPDGSLLTYLWTPPSGIVLNSNTVQKPAFSAPEVTNNTDYTFSLVVNDGNYNSTVDQVVITIQNCTPTAPTVGTITQPTCSLATGNVVLNGLPATGTWTLTRTPGAITTTGSGTSSTISSLAAGTYTFTVTNASGCISPASASVVINTLVATADAPTLGTITQPTCALATGSVVLNGLPATGTWTLTRSPDGTTTTGSGTSSTISSLAAGTYTFTVTNASGCISPASASVLINTQASTPSAPTIGTITQPTCALATGSVTLTGLPDTGTWTLTRSPGGTTTTGSGTSSTISSLAAGTYNFTVTNASGCISPASANVVINTQASTPSAPTIGTITQPTCALATGSVTLTGLPDIGTWTLTRSPGGITTTGTGTSSTISLLAAGTYTFTVTNASGCISPASASVVINTQVATADAPTIGTITQPTCAVAAGSVVLSGLPATGTWTLTRTPGGTTTTGSGTSSTISSLAAGTYNFTVTNASGCISPASANVVINTQASTPSAPTIGTITQPTCALATGSVTLTGLPATGTWIITRSPGGTTTTGSGTSSTISLLAVGTYTFTVTNASGCISPASASVVINTQVATADAPTIGTITQPTCAVAAGSVVLSGLPATGTWTLTRTPGGIITTGSGTSSTISPLAAGTYTFTVTNASGCISPASANVVINTQVSSPDAPTIGTITQPTCSLETGSVVLNGLPDTGTWTLTRTPGGTTVTGTGTSSTISSLAAGTYTFTVTNASGCISPASASMVINAQPSTPTAPTIGTITQLTCALATGSVVLNGLPATGTWTLTRTPGGIITTGSGTSSTISSLAAGTYTFSVTNASGCISPASASVVINAQVVTPDSPTLGTITQPTCALATGSVVLNGLPATGTWTLTRTPGGTTTTGSGTSSTISSLAAGTYTFTVTNASGCISPASASVVINAQVSSPDAPTIGTITQPTCSVGTGSVVLNGLPDIGTWTLTRTPGGTITTGTGTSSTISSLPAGTYIFTVTNASGCVSQASASVAIHTQPGAPSAPTIGTISQPTCAISTGSITLSGLPATGTWIITRAPGGTTTAGSGTSSTISLLPAGTYTFTVTNASGCISQASASVAINAQASTPAAPIIETITQSTCDISTGSVVLSGLPATGTWTLTRSPGAVTSTGTGISSTISSLQAGTYTFSVSTASGCISLASASVTINAQGSTPLSPTVGAITQPTCAVATGSVVLNGLPATGTWTLTRSPGGTTTTGTGTSSTISLLTAGTYTFIVTNASGCISPASANVVINTQVSTADAPTIGTITQPTCALATGSVVLSGLPATGTWTLTRSPGGTTTTGLGTSSTISSLAAGTYTFTVTNASGCISPASANVVINTQPATPTAPILGTTTQPTCAISTGSVNLSGLPATSTWTLTRSPGGITTTGTGTSSTISLLASGIYTFTVTNSSGCISPASANVVINTQASTPSAPTIGTITQPTCALATGSVTLTGLPATGTWIITRSPGGITTTGTGTSSTISSLAAGTYTFTVTNISGCVSQASPSVVINTQASTPSAPSIGTITQPSCGVATGSVVLSGLPATGTWTLTRTPGGITTTGTGTSSTISSLAAGTYNFTVTNASGCISPASASVVINTQASTPTAPILGTITQPTCAVATGSVVLSGLPATGTWTLTKSPGGITTTGSGTISTISLLAAGTYTFTVTNASGCISPASASVVINTQVATPDTPTVGTITQPTLTITTGSVVLSGLPATGAWTLTRSPGNITSSGTGTSSIISLLPAGTYSFTVTNASGCISPASENIVINAKPLANAGVDQFVNEAALVTLDGSLSSDPDGNPVTLKWTAPEEILLSSNTDNKPTFIAPEVTADKEYIFSLVANDGSLNSTPDQIVITVKQVNKAPTADAGIDQSVNENSLFTLDGSGSTDPDNDVLTYLWTAPAEITLNANNIQKPTFTAPEVSVNTNYTFTLVVKDGILESPSDQVTVTVKQGNKAPTSNAGTNQSVDEGILVTLDGSASNDPDNDPLGYIWTAPEGIILSSTSDIKPTFVAPEVAHGTILNFSLIVKDGTVHSIADQVLIQVKQINKAPVANAGPDQNVAPNQLIRLNGTSSSDPDNDLLTYHWIYPTGIVLSNPNSANPEFQSPYVSADTDYLFKLMVNDGELDSPVDEVIVRVLTYRIPTADAGADFSSDEGSIVSLDASASSDPKGGTLTYQWIAPSGIILSSTTDQKPNFKAPEVAQDSPYTFTLVVSNGVSNSIADQVTVTIKQVNIPPVANAGTDYSIDEFTMATLNGSESFDLDNDEISYLWTPPAGINLSSNSVMKPVFFTPNVDSDTNYTFKLTVNDGKITSLPDYVVITVRNGNLKPVANAGIDQVVDEGTVISLDGTGSSDANNNALTYLWTAPNGIVLSSASVSKPTFTAPEVQSNQTYTFTLKVNDGKIDSFTDEVKITVINANKMPVANAGADQSVGITTIVSLNGSQSFDPENDEITYLWTAPSGINLSSNSVMNPAFFTPFVGSDTDFIFKLTVSDRYHTSLPDFVVITVRGDNKRPLANAGFDKEINEGTLTSLDGSLSSDPDNDVLTYHWTAPNGITLSSLSAAKPTFTAPEVQTDVTYTFILTVNDGKTDSYTDEVKITVKQVNKAPYANAGTDQSVNENSVFTLDGSQSFDPENDEITYLWTAPAGIILSSASSAKPSFSIPDVSDISKFTFTLTVNDGKLNSTPDQVVITVRQDNQAPTANAGSDQFVTQGSIVTLDGTSSKDPNGDVITYRWAAPSGIVLSSTTSGKPLFTAPAVTANTNFTFTLIVSDGTLNSISDQVVITVKRVNNSPVYTSSKSFKVHKDEPFNFTLEGIDMDNDPISFSIENLPSFLKLTKINATATALSGTFTSQNLGNHPYILTLSDGTLSIDELISIEVTNGDVPPYVKNSIQNVSVDKGSSDKIVDLRTIFADDNPGDELRYSVSSNTNQNIVTTKIIGSYLFLSFSTINIGISELEVTAISNGKIAQSKFKVEVQIPTGIDPVIENSDVRIYPNPAREKVYVKFDQQPKPGTWITVYNDNGKIISRKLVDNQEEIINMKNLAPGLYLIKIDQTLSKTYKVVLNK